METAARDAFGLFIHLAFGAMVLGAIGVWAHAEGQIRASERNFRRAAGLVGGRVARPWLRTPFRIVAEGRYEGRVVRFSVINRLFGGSEHYEEIEVSMAPRRIAADLTVHRPKRVPFFQPVKHTRLEHGLIWYEPWAELDRATVSRQALYCDSVSEEQLRQLLARLGKAAEIVETHTTLPEFPPDTWEPLQSLGGTPPEGPSDG